MKINFKNFFEKFSFILIFLYCILPFVLSIVNVLNYNISYDFRFIYTLIIGLLSLLLFITYLIKELKKPKINLKNILPIILLCLFFIWACLSALFSFDKKIAFLGSEYRKEGVLSYLFYGGFIGLGAMIKNEKKYIILGNILLLTAIFAGIINYLSTNLSLRLFLNLPYSGFFHHPNHFGYFLDISIIISIILFLKNKSKIFKIYYFVTYLFLLFILIINNTFGSYLAILFSLVILLIYLIKNKFYKYGILIIVPFLILSCTLKTSNYENNKVIVFDNFIVLAYDLRIIVKPQYGYLKKYEPDKENIDSVGSFRGGLWRNGLNFIKQKPIFGYGPDSLEREYNKVNIYMDRAHNLIIQLAASVGIIGALLYFSSLIITLIKTYNKSKFNMAISLIILCYLISAMFGNSMYTISPYFMFLYGILIGRYIDGDKYV